MLSISRYPYDVELSEIQIGKCLNKKRDYFFFPGDRVFPVLQSCGKKMARGNCLPRRVTHVRLISDTLCDGPRTASRVLPCWIGLPGNWKDISIC